MLGKPVDGRGEVEAGGYRPIQPAPIVTDLSTNTELFETGIKVIDLLTPFVRGGKAGLFGGAGLGKTVILTELIARTRVPTVVILFSLALGNVRGKVQTCGWKCRKLKSVTLAEVSSSKPVWYSGR